MAKFRWLALHPSTGRKQKEEVELGTGRKQKEEVRLGGEGVWSTYGCGEGDLPGYNQGTLYAYMKL